MRGFILLLGLFYFALAAAQEPVIEQGMSIIGDREQPRILYIVPWKKPEAVERMPIDPLEVVTNLISTLDPEEFEHELAYYEHMKEQRKKAKFTNTQRKAR